MQKRSFGKNAKGEEATLYTFENKNGIIAANTSAITRYKEAKGLTKTLDKIKYDAEKKDEQFSFSKNVFHKI